MMKGGHPGRIRRAQYHGSLDTTPHPAGHRGRGARDFLPGCAPFGTRCRASGRKPVHARRSSGESPLPGTVPSIWSRALPLHPEHDMTAMLRVSRRVVNETLWPGFQAISSTSSEHLVAVTTRVISEVSQSEDTETEVRGALPPGGSRAYLWKTGTPTRRGSTPRAARRTVEDTPDQVSNPGIASRSGIFLVGNSGLRNHFP